MNVSLTRRLRAVLTLFIGLLFAVCAIATDEISEANCRVDTVNSSATIYSSEQGPDAGFDVRVTVRNAGKSGQVTIVARLSTSEGEWEKERHESLEAGASATRTFAFPEPSVSATDVRSYGGCKPQQ